MKALSPQLLLHIKHLLQQVSEDRNNRFADRAKRLLLQIESECEAQS